MLLNWLDQSPDDNQEMTGFGGLWDSAGDWLSNKGEQVIGAVNEYTDDKIADFLGDDYTDPVQDKAPEASEQKPEGTYTRDLTSFVKAEGDSFIIAGVAIPKMVAYGVGAIVGVVVLKRVL